MEKGFEFWKRLESLDTNNELNKLSALARATGLDQRTLWETKNKKGLPRLDNALALARHFNTTIEFLMVGKEPEELKPSLTYLVDALNNAEEEQLSAIRLILGVKKISNTEVGKDVV